MTLPHPGSLTPSEVLRIASAELDKGKASLPVEYQRALVECLEYALKTVLESPRSTKYNPRQPLRY